MTGYFKGRLTVVGLAMVDSVWVLILIMVGLSEPRSLTDQIAVPRRCLWLPAAGFMLLAADLPPLMPLCSLLSLLPLCSLLSLLPLPAADQRALTDLVACMLLR